MHILLFSFLTSGILTDSQCEANMIIDIAGDEIPSSNVDSGGYAYACRDVLTTVVLKSSSLKAIGMRAFKNCPKLISIDLTNCPNLQTLRYHAFGCCGFTSFTIPDTICYMENGVFISCSNLEKVTISPTSNLVQMSDYIFENTKITSLFIPEKVTTLGMCVDHTPVHTITSSSPNFVVIDNAVFDKNKENLIMFTPRITGTYRIPSTVLTLRNSAFRSSYLSFVEVPSSVISIGESCFSYMKNLKYIAISDNLNTFPILTFAYCPQLYYIFVPSSVTTLEANVFTGSAIKCGHFPPIFTETDLINAGLSPSVARGECAPLFTPVKIGLWKASLLLTLLPTIIA